MVLKSITDNGDNWEILLQNGNNTRVSTIIVKNSEAGLLIDALLRDIPSLVEKELYLRDSFAI